MLSEAVLDLVIDRLVDRIETGNEYILKKMGESIKKIGTLTPTEAQQLAQTLKYGGDYEKIANKLAEITNMNVKDIYKIFEEVAKADQNFAKQFYKYNKKKFIPYAVNKALKSQVRAIAEMTANKIINISKTTVLGYGWVDEETGEITYKDLKNIYYDLIDEAVLSVGQGKESFDSAMYRQLKTIGESGLKVIYPTTYIDKKGRERHYVRRLDTSVRMNMKDSLKEMHNKLQEQFGKEFGADGWEVSVHGNPAPDHMYVQGKQFSKEEFDKFQNDEDSISYDGVKFPAESSETGHDRRSIGQYNCYHKVFSIVLGVSQPEYTNKELEEIIAENNKGFEFDGKHYTNYEGTQLQRSIETAIRQAKDDQILGVSSNNEDMIRESQERIRILTDKYDKLSKISGLPTKIERMQVAGYKPIKLNDNIITIPKEK